MSEAIMRKVRLSVDMTEEDMRRALQLQRIAMAMKRGELTVRPARGKKPASTKHDAPKRNGGDE